MTEAVPPEAPSTEKGPRKEFLAALPGLVRTSVFLASLMVISEIWLHFLSGVDVLVLSHVFRYELRDRVAKARPTCKRDDVVVLTIESELEQAIKCAMRPDCSPKAPSGRDLRLTIVSKILDAHPAVLALDYDMAPRKDVNMAPTDREIYAPRQKFFKERPARVGEHPSATVLMAVRQREGFDAQDDRNRFLHDACLDRGARTALASAEVAITGFQRYPATFPLIKPPGAEDSPQIYPALGQLTGIVRSHRADVTASGSSTAYYCEQVKAARTGFAERAALTQGTTTDNAPSSPDPPQSLPFIDRAGGVLRPPKGASGAPAYSRAFVNYLAWPSIKHVKLNSMADLDELLRPGTTCPLKEATVFLGAGASIGQDTFSTPLSGETPGVLVHALVALSTQQFGLRPLPQVGWLVDIALGFCFGLALQGSLLLVRRVFAGSHTLAASVQMLLVALATAAMLWLVLLFMSQLLERGAWLNPIAIMIGLGFHLLNELFAQASESRDKTASTETATVGWRPYLFPRGRTGPGDSTTLVACVDQKLIFVINVVWWAVVLIAIVLLVRGLSITIN